jgi:hypothetical protein
MNCDNTVGGICYLNGACSNYAALWTYSFKLTFSNNANSNYMNVPLSAFAVDGD